MPCSTITLPDALVLALGALDAKYVSVITGAQFMCNVRGYLVDDMLIGTYRDLVAAQLGTALFYMSTIIMTIWVIYHGFMIMTGGNKQPILPLFLKTGKMALVLSLVALIAARSHIIADWVADFQELITAAIVGPDIDLYQVIDINLALGQVFNALIDGLAGGQQAMAEGKSLTTMAGLVGQSGPAVLLSVLSLMAEISIVLAIMLAPLFLFFLLFQQTAAMFWTWVKFLLGTMVSLAVVTLVGSIVLDMMMRYGGALVFAFFVNGALGAAGVGGGFDIGGSAMQLAALGALSTALLTMIPPLIMQFFNSGASFAAGAMMGAVGGGAAGAGVAGLMGSVGAGSGAARAALQSGGGAGGLGYSGGEGNGSAGSTRAAGVGPASATNQGVLEQVSRLSSGQAGAGGSVGGASALLGSRGVAAQGTSQSGLADVQSRQRDLGSSEELRLNERTGVYETKDTPRQLADNPGLGRGYGSPVAVSGSAGSTATAASNNAAAPVDMRGGGASTAGAPAGEIVAVSPNSHPKTTAASAGNGKPAVELPYGKTGR